MFIAVKVFEKKQRENSKFIFKCYSLFYRLYSEETPKRSYCNFNVFLPLADDKKRSGENKSILTIRH